MDYFATVYFATSVSSTITGAIKLGFIQAFTCSKLTHCMFGFGNTVIDPTFQGIHFRDNGAVFYRYPTLHSAFHVPMPHPVDFMPYKRLVGVQQPIFPRLWRYLTCGRYGYIYDCVSVVQTFLEAGGVDLGNTSAVSPRGLYDALTMGGFRHYDKSYIHAARAGVSAVKRIRSNAVATGIARA